MTHQKLEEVWGSKAKLPSILVTRWTAGVQFAERVNPRIFPFSVVSRTALTSLSSHISWALFIRAMQGSCNTSEISLVTVYRQIPERFKYK
jgi:hypothetical protein